MGNYVIAGVGNYVIINPSNLGNYVIADIVKTNATASARNSSLYFDGRPTRDTPFLA